jgi:hypothetical protein
MTLKNLCINNMNVNEAAISGLTICLCIIKKIDFTFKTVYKYKYKY